MSGLFAITGLGLVKAFGGLFLLGAKAALTVVFAAGMIMGLPSIAKGVWNTAKKVPVLGNVFKGIEWGAKKAGKLIKGTGRITISLSKKIWSMGKKIPVIGNVFKGIEGIAKKVAGFPHFIWKNAKKAPVIGHICLLAEELVYNLKTNFNKRFLELRVNIAKIKAIFVELIFKVLKILDKETASNGVKAAAKRKKREKAVSKARKKDREPLSTGKSKDIMRSEPLQDKPKDIAKSVSGEVKEPKAPAAGKNPIVTTDVAEKISSLKGIAVPGNAAPVIAAGKEIGQGLVKKPLTEKR